MLPYIKHMAFPIQPALCTMGAVVGCHNEFDRKKDAKGNLSFLEKANKHIGGKKDKIRPQFFYSSNKTIAINISKL